MEDFIVGGTYMTKTQIPEPVTILEFLGENSVYVFYNNNPEIGKCLLEKSRLKPKEKQIKITFGIQPKMLERIEQLSAHWDSVREWDDMEILKEGWIKYDRSFWQKLGEEFGWEPLTLALHYFEHINKQ